MPNTVIIYSQVALVGVAMLNTVIIYYQVELVGVTMYKIE